MNTKADFAKTLANYDESKDDFILDDLLSQIPPSLHLEAYKRLKLADGYINIATLSKIVKEMRLNLNQDIRGESEKFADGLIQKFSYLFELLTKQNLLKDFEAKFENYNWKDLQINDKLFFDEKELYLLNNFKLDLYKLHYQLSDYKPHFMEFFEIRKRQSLNIEHKEKPLLQIANLAKIKRIGNAN